MEKDKCQGCSICQGTIVLRTRMSEKRITGVR